MTGESGDGSTAAAGAVGMSDPREPEHEIGQPRALAATEPGDDEWQAPAGHVDGPALASPPLQPDPPALAAPSPGERLIEVAAQPIALARAILSTEASGPSDQPVRPPSVLPGEHDQRPTVPDAPEESRQSMRTFGAEAPRPVAPLGLAPPSATRPAVVHAPRGLRPTTPQSAPPTPSDPGDAPAVAPATAAPELAAVRASAPESAAARTAESNRVATRPSERGQAAAGVSVRTAPDGTQPAPATPASASWSTIVNPLPAKAGLPALPALAADPPAPASARLARGDESTRPAAAVLAAALSDEGRWSSSPPTQQRTSVSIGRVDVQIVPVESHPAPPPARLAPPRQPSTSSDPFAGRFLGRFNMRP